MNHTLRTPILVGILILASATGTRAGLTQTNLVSDQPGMALHRDSDLVNAWGMSHGTGGPLWISDNGPGLATLYDGKGVKSSLVVTIPPAGSGTPTGQVFNTFGSSAFGGNAFIFVSEDGTISAWKGADGTMAQTMVPGSLTNVYKGVTLGASGGNDFLYAANFRQGTVDVFDSSFGKTSLAGTFVDPTLPAGYAPFNVQNFGGKLFVTYAVQDGARHDDVAGSGHGVVAVFNTDGTFVKELTAGGSLNSPWGLAMSPAGWGYAPFSNALLVGNFGDGTINAFDPTTGTFLGQLKDQNGNVLQIDGLWGLEFGAGVKNAKATDLYFTAGPNGESDGLFGRLTPSPEPSTFVLFGFGAAGLALAARRRSTRGANSSRS
jgi:uncharacterized protein (TIGR03118 family)